MQYDFTTLPQRWESNGEKFWNMKQRCPQVTSDILPFSVADMDFMPPPQLTQGLQNFLGREILGYTLPSLTYHQTVLQWMEARHGLTIPREWLVDTDTVIGAMRQMIMAYTKPQDQIVVFSPAYPPFFSSVTALGREVLDCPLVLGEDLRYQINFDQLEAFCRQSTTTMLLFCSPHNPVGRVWTGEELIRVAEICLENHVFFLSDEIHWDLALPGADFTSVASLPERYLANCAVNAASTKTFNTAALKGSYALIPDETRRRQYMDLDGISGRSILSFVATEVGYTQCAPWLDELLVVLDDNRRVMTQFMAAELPQVGVIPLEATYLQWLDFRCLGMDFQAQEVFMAEKAQCFFTEGFKFGPAGRGFERWNIACPQASLLAGLERMADAVRRL